MNVLALVTDAFGGFGGIAQYNRDLLTALSRCDGANRVVVLPRLGRAESALPPGVRQLPARNGKLAYGLAAFRAARREGPHDVVFCGHLHLAPLATIVARYLRRPLWLQLHGVEAWRPPTPWQRWAANRASLVTAVSRFTRRRFLALHGADPARVRVLPNAVDARFTPGAKPDYLLDRHRLRGKKVLLTVGRLDPLEGRKGHDRVIAALPALIKICPDIVYLIAGKGEDRARLAALARPLGVEDRVVFAGMVEARELADYYRLADVFVMPSSQEGFGIVFLEAAACGLKVIGGDRDGSADALADGAIGVAIDPADPDALVRVIADALTGHGPDPARVRRFGFDNFSSHVCDLTASHLLDQKPRAAA